MIRCGHEPAEVLARQELFASLSQAERIALARRSPCRAVRRGEILFREGEECRGLYLILEGEVRLYRSNRAGREQVLATHHAGELLGEVALFDEGPALAGARAMRDGRILFLPLADIQELFLSRPEMARAVVRELAGRVRKLATLLDRVTLQDVPARVANALLEEAERADAAHPGATFRLPCTQEELASELGTARESVARALRELRECGAIAQKGRHIELRDPAMLRRAAQGRSLDRTRISRAAPDRAATRVPHPAHPPG